MNEIVEDASLFIAKTKHGPKEKRGYSWKDKI